MTRDVRRDNCLGVNRLGDLLGGAPLPPPEVHVVIEKQQVMMVMMMMMMMMIIIMIMVMTIFDVHATCHKCQPTTNHNARIACVSSSAPFCHVTRFRPPAPFR